MRLPRELRLLLGCLALVGLAAPVAAQSETPANHPSAPPGGSEYIIGPADVLQILVWKEPDLSRDVTVRFDGVVTVPLLGDLVAVGQSPAQLAATLERGYQRFVEAPRVTVGVNRATSARFYVLGQVQKSGEFPLDGPTNVLQALALAGGFKDFAKTESIVIVRKDQSMVAVNYKRIADGKDVSQNVVLLPGDTVLVP